MNSGSYSSLPSILGRSRARLHSSTFARAQKRILRQTAVSSLSPIAKPRQICDDDYSNAFQTTVFWVRKKEKRKVDLAGVGCWIQSMARSPLFTGCLFTEY